jgi:hypothetical protein
MRKFLLTQAHRLADDIARNMKHYPMLLRADPPILLDIDIAYSQTRRMHTLHIAATRADRRFD